MQFSIAYPFIFILCCLLLGAGYAFFLYGKSKNLFEKKYLKYLLPILRGLVVSILAFLLLNPIFRQMQNVEEKPSIVLLQDNSSSQKYAFRNFDSIQYKKDFQNLASRLQKEYNVKVYHYGDNLNPDFAFNYKQQSTDISTNLEKVMQSFDNENLAAIILSSDGIYNQGINPANMNLAFTGSIYSIGLGDTTVQKDAAVSRVFANKVVYLGDQFAIRSDINVFAGQGQQVQIAIFNHAANSIISSKNVVVDAPQFSTQIESIIDANRAGLQRYTISVSVLQGEKNIKNNSQDIFVEVLDSKEKILILSNSPHPDIAVLRNVIESQKNYQLTVSDMESFKGNVGDYNLILLHNLPSTKFNANSVISTAKNLGISLWYFVGNQCAIPLLNHQQNAVQITARSTNGANAFAHANTNFSYFNMATIPWEQYPPLQTPFGTFNAGPNTQTLLNQRIGNVNTDYPLWILQNANVAKTAITCGEGVWRWAMYDYQQHKNYNQLQELLLKTIQFLSVKNDKRKFKVQSSKQAYTQNEAIVFNAELYNENYELISSSEVNLSVKDSAGKINTFTMNKESNAYELNIGNLAAGAYSYQANTVFNDKTLSASGNFQVIAQNIEESNLSADFSSLKELAEKHSGEFVFANQINTLYDKIKKNPNVKSILHSELQTFPLIDKKWLFFFLFALLATEWFLRKRFGSY